MGVLTFTWYTCLCLPFGVIFHEIWYGDRGGGLVHQRWRSPNYINWVYFGQIFVKSTPFDQNWVLFFWKIMVYWLVGNGAKNWYRESLEPGGLLSLKSHVDVPAGPRLSDFLYTNFRVFACLKKKKSLRTFLCHWNDSYKWVLVSKVKRHTVQTKSENPSGPWVRPWIKHKICKFLVRV